MGFTKLYSATILALLLAMPSLAQDAPAPKKKDDNPNITCTPGWSGYYRPQRWMPLQFQVVIENPTKEAYDGTLRVVAKQDSLVEMTTEKSALVTKNLPLEVTLAVKILYAPNDIKVEYLEKSGTFTGYLPRWSENIAQTRRLTALLNQDLLFVVVKDFGSSSLVQLTQRYNAGPGVGMNYGPSAGTGAIRVSTQAVDKLPDDWAVYDAVDLVILQDPQWQRMTQPARQALVQWVHRGGKLLLALGGSNPLTGDHALAAMLPFSVGPLAAREIEAAQLERWGTAATSERMATSWANGRTTVAHWDLSAAPATWSRNTFHNTDVPWMVSGNVGLGQVGVVAFNPDALFTDDVGSALPMWVQAIDMVRPDEAHLNTGPPTEDEIPYYDRPSRCVPGDPQATNSVISHLLAIPQLRPLSIWWVIGLLSALALLLGPLDYLVLRKFDRLPWTWITSTVVIVLFSIGAWYGVQRIRGGTLQMRVVSVVDGVEAPNKPGQPAHTSATYYGGIFAPESSNYVLDTPGRDGRLSAETSWWSAISPDGGRYGYNDYSLVSRPLGSAQDDTGNRLVSLPISIWSMQCLLNETQDAAIPIHATVYTVGGPGETRQIKVVVTNLSDREIVSGEVRLFGTTWQQLRFNKRIPPGDSETFEGPLAFTDEMTYSGRWVNNSSTFRPEAAFFAAGTLERTRAIERLLKQGAALVTVRYDDASLPFTIAKRNNDVVHIQMARLVVWPKAGQ